MIFRMAEETKTKAAEQQRKVRNVSPPEGLTLIYTNNVAIGATSFDLRLVLGQILEVTPEELVVLQNSVVAMS